MIQVIAIYTGVLAAIYLVLSVRTVRGRLAYRISLGDGDNADMRARVRAHGNFAEYVPISLLLMWLLGSFGFSLWLIHAMGIALVIARVLHPFGVTMRKSPNMPRAVGVTLTLLVLAVGAVLALLAGAAGVRF